MEDNYRKIQMEIEEVYYAMFPTQKQEIFNRITKKIENTFVDKKDLADLKKELKNAMNAPLDQALSFWQILNLRMVSQNVDDIELNRLFPQPVTITTKEQYQQFGVEF